jgi:hypothetical protein
MRGFVVLLLGMGLAVAGCRRSDLVEAELRTRERQLRETREELDRTEGYNAALQHELKDLRQNPAAKISPEQASQIYGVRGIALGLQTGGYHGDSRQGDQALQVVLEPRDPDGQAIKAPGSLNVIALEINPEGLKTPLSSWTIGSDQLRRTWRNGLFSTGYYVMLPWKKWPSTTRLRVVAQFTLSDGRAFEAEKDVTLHLIPDGHRQPPPAMSPADPLAPDLGEIDLPSPPPGRVPDAQCPLTKTKAFEPVSKWNTTAAQSTSGAIQLLGPRPNQ